MCRVCVGAYVLFFVGVLCVGVCECVVCFGVCVLCVYLYWGLGVLCGSVFV